MENEISFRRYILRFDKTNTISSDCFTSVHDIFASLHFMYELNLERTKPFSFQRRSIDNCNLPTTPKMVILQFVSTMKTYFSCYSSYCHLLINTHTIQHDQWNKSSIKLYFKLSNSILDTFKYWSPVKWCVLCSARFRYGKFQVTTTITMSMVGILLLTSL